jgi:hypothetical protein
MMKLFMSAFTFVSLLVTGHGCATPVSLDPSPPAAASNYPTAEFWAQGKLFHGLGEVALKKGQSLSDIDLKVQGYFEGTIRVDSSFCHLRKSASYSGMELVAFPLTGTASESCVVDIVVTTVYPQLYDSTTLVYEMKGQLLVKVIPDQKPFFLASSKVQDRTDTNLFVPVEATMGSVQALFKGCGVSYVDSVPVNDGDAMISARSLSGPAPLDRCVYEGFLEGLGGVKRVSWAVWIYAKEFAPLPLPRLDFNGDTLRIDGDASVAAIVFDKSYKFGSKASFKLNQDEDHMLRLLTVKGRSVVCQWVQGKGEWVCRQ